MKKSFDLSLLITVLILVFIGVMMVFSSSFYYTLSRWGDKYYYFKKSIEFAIAGIFIMITLIFFDYRRYKKLSIPLLIISIVGLILVLTSMGVKINGSRRWLSIGFNFMPSELAKLSIIIFCANSMSTYQKYIKEYWLCGYN